MITQLTGLEVANASMYDGASATAEAVLMAHRVTPKRSRVALSLALWPDYRDTVRTYLSALEHLELVEVPLIRKAARLILRRWSALPTNGCYAPVSAIPTRSESSSRWAKPPRSPNARAELRFR